MSEIKIMVVPGKIARVQLTAGMTVLAACEVAERQMPGIGWAGLAKDREVRVQNRKFSNTVEIPSGFFGSIATTPLNDGEVVLILTKIKGNDGPGLGVLTCVVDGVEYALETPDQVGNILSSVVGYDLSKVKAIHINGEASPLDQLIGNGDVVEVKTVTPTSPTPAVEPEDDFSSSSDDDDEENPADLRSQAASFRAEADALEQRAAEIEAELAAAAAHEAAVVENFRKAVEAMRNAGLDPADFFGGEEEQ